MPTTSTLARPPARTSGSGGDIVSLFVFVSLAAALLVAVSSLLFDDERIDMTFENPTDYEISVAVRTPHEGTRTQLGTLAPGSTRVVTGVIDPGAQWHLEFSSAGVDAGTLTVAADAVDGSIVVPDHVAEALAAAGLDRAPG